MYESTLIGRGKWLVAKKGLQSTSMGIQTPSKGLYFLRKIERNDECGWQIPNIAPKDPCPLIVTSWCNPLLLSGSLLIDRILHKWVGVTSAITLQNGTGFQLAPFPCSPACFDEAATVMGAALCNGKGLRMKACEDLRLSESTILMCGEVDSLPHQALK